MNGKILIVDDEPDILASLEIMLANQGHDVLTAISGEEGVAAAKSGKPDLVLMDIMLPGIDGFEACRKIKQSPHTKNIPVLLLTALNDSSSKVKGLDAGADDFVTKPFSDSELKARVRAFLRTKRMHDELEKSFIRLKELEEMRDLLTHTLVHDLKTPLTSIKGALSIVTEQIKQNEEMGPDHLRLLQNAETSANKILSLIQDILDVGRLEENKLPVHKQMMNLSQLAHECLDIIDPIAAQNGIMIEKSLPPNFPEINSDSEILRRVLLNLASNSLKFTERGGKIELELHDLSNENQIECVLKDSGIGIAPENLEKIFDKFFQGSNPTLSRRGQGLGLAFCRLAIESLGGRIWAESEERKGSRFVIRLPLI